MAGSVLGRQGADSGQSRLVHSRRDMLKTIGGVSALGVSAGCTASSITGSSGPTNIKMYAWDSYAMQDLVDVVESNLDVNLEVTATSSSSKMFSAFNAGQDEQFDVAIPNNNDVPRFIDADLVAPIQMDAVSNFEELYPKFKEFAQGSFAEDGTVYGVPTRFGWYGYSYDSRKLPESHEKSFEVLFSESYEGTELDGEVVMFDGFFKAMAVTALYLGYRDAFDGRSYSLSEQQIQKVKRTLIEQKPLLEAYMADSSQYTRSWLQGNHIVGQSGRNAVIKMNRDGHDWARMAAPKEGSLSWFEGAVVSKESENKEMAWKVVNEYISPKVGALLARLEAAPSTTPTTEQHLEGLNKETLVVDPGRLEAMIPFKPVENEKLWIEAWEEVKAA
jgi:spermidine/putrescine transport system substrate-binding protein